MAMDMHDALQQRTDVVLESAVLRSTWQDIGLNTAKFLTRLLFRLPQLVRQHEANVVLFSSMVTALLVIPFARTLRKKGVRTFAIVHGQDITIPVAVYQFLVRMVYRKIDGILPVSSATGDACIQRGLSPEKCHVVPNGIRLDRFLQTLSRAEARSALRNLLGGNVQDDALLLCSVGRQVERKGFHWFIENVMPQLPPQVHYVLAGDGPMAERIREAIRTQNLEPRTHWLGRVSDKTLELVFRGADLFIMPNVRVKGDMEGFGVVLLEAGICGQPAIAARIEGIRDVIHEGENGHFVETEDVDGFIRAILPYLNREQLRMASERTAAYIPQVFSWDGAVDRLLDILRR